MKHPSRLRHVALRLVAVTGLVFLMGGGATLLPTTAAQASSGTTVTSGLHAWQWNPHNPKQKGQLYTEPRSVTVSQTSNLVSQVVHVSWQNFSASGALSAINPGQYPVRIYECDSADPVTPAHCFGDLNFGTLHPGYDVTGSQTNYVQTFTGADSTGGADVALQTAADNPALGCSPTHQCSLVVEPWAGGDSLGVGKKGPGDGDGTTPDCADHSLDTVVNKGGYGNWSIVGSDGKAWDMGCDWAARIVVPLSFAPTPLNCPNKNAQFQTEGSPLMKRAMDQWRTGICTAKTHPLQVGYTGLSEYQARSDFDRDATDVALTSQPDTNRARPKTYAPVGVSTIAIAYYVDNQQTGQPITDLRLDPRLLAKLLTQSYTSGLSTDCANPGGYACAPEVAGNPSSIFADPEFQALNPQYSLFNYPLITEGNGSPDVVYGQSDLTYQLTRWIAADPAAEAFLHGTPDQWGMHVNTAYLPSKSPRYPISSLTADDAGQTLSRPSCGFVGKTPFSCAVAGMQNTWFPINGLDNVASTFVGGKNTAKLYVPSCDGNSPPIQGVCTNYVSTGQEALGTRGIFAVVAGSDAAAFQFPTAQLETHTGSGKFVSLSDASVTKALGDMTTNADGITQSLDYKTLNDPDAYPLTTPTYAMLPTCGLTGSSATALSQFLTYVGSTAGNTSGVEPGNLAPGYLPLPQAMRTQTDAAARTVASEKACSGGGPGPGGTSTSPGGTQSSGSGTVHHGRGNDGGNNAAANNGGGVNGNSGDGTVDQAGNGSASPSGAGPSSSASPGPSSSTSVSAAPAAFRSVPDSAGGSALVLPIVLIVGIALLLVGPTLALLSHPGASRAMRGRLRFPGRG